MSQQPTITTPHLAFLPHEVPNPWKSEQVAYDNRLAAEVARPLFDAGVILAAITERIDYGWKQPRRQAHHEVTLLLQGRMEVRAGERIWELSPGELFYCPPGTPSCRFGPGETWWLYFKLFDSPHWEAWKRRSAYVKPYPSAALIFLLLRGILDAHASRVPAAMAQARDHSRALADMLGHEMAAAAGHTSARRRQLEQLADRIAQNPERDWHLQGMARSLHLSVRQFSRLFQKEYGVSPMALVAKQRMNLAISRLLHTDDTVEAVANAVGYQSVYSFSRLFTRHIGIPPGSYRRQYRGE